MQEDVYEALARDIQQTRREFLERLAQMEVKLDAMQHGTAVPRGRTAEIQPPKNTPAPTLPAPPAPAPVDWDHLIKVWLPRVFILVLLIGVVFGFTAAVKAGILTPPVRCLIGYVAGSAFVGLGELQLRAKRAALGQVLIGGGVSILVLSTFAANMLYTLVPGTPAFVLDLVFIAAGVFFSLRHQSEALACVSLAGAVLIPFLIETGHPSTIFFAAYELVCSVAFLYYAVKRKYTVLYYASLGLLHLSLLSYLVLRTVAGFGGTKFTPSNQADLAVCVALQHIALLCAYLFLDRDTTGTRVSLWSSFAITACWWELWLPFNGMTKWLLLGAFILYSAVAAWKRLKSGPAVVASAVASFALMLFLNDVFNGASKCTPFLLEGSVAILLGIYLKSRMQSVAGAVIYSVGLIVLLANPLSALFSGLSVAWLIVLLTIPLFRLRLRPLVPRLDVYLFSTEALLLLVFVTEAVMTQNLSVEMQHLYVSLSWIAYAIALVTVGLVRNSKTARLAGVGLLFVTLAKLIIIDLPSVSVLIRAVLFTGLGVVGIFVSRLFYRRSADKPGQSQ